MSYFAYAGPDIDDDYALWMERQVELIREKQFSQLDLDNLLDELGGMVIAKKHALRSRLQVLMTHLLKCEVQPQLKSHSWLCTLTYERIGIDRLVDENPSFARLVLPFAQKEYAAAIRAAVRETGLPKSSFPATLPYTEAQLLDEDFIP